jgi:hypothetical protein
MAHRCVRCYGGSSKSFTPTRCTSRNMKTSGGGGGMRVSTGEGANSPVGTTFKVNGSALVVGGGLASIYGCDGDP